LDHIFKALLQEGELVLIIGSFFIMREVHLFFDLKVEEDPFELNER